MKIGLSSFDRQHTGGWFAISDHFISFYVREALSVLGRLAPFLCLDTLLFLHSEEGYRVFLADQGHQLSTNLEKREDYE